MVARSTVLLQHARDDDYGRLLDLTEKRHQEYADMNGMEYRRYDGESWGREGWTPHWDQIEVILHVMREGKYSEIYWLDADTMIVDPEQDMQEALGWSELTMVRHPGPPTHWNCGVLFARNTPHARAFFEATLAQGPGFYPWYQQRVMCDLLAEFPWIEMISQLDDRWNSTWGINECDDPAIVAWHNGRSAEKKLAAMVDYQEGLDGRI